MSKPTTDAERAGAISRSVRRLRAFLEGYDQAAGMTSNPMRDEILSELTDVDRDRFLAIERHGLNRVATRSRVVTLTPEEWAAFDDWMNR